MAKYNHKHTAIDKLKETASNVLEFRQPILIERNKLEIAHAKVKKIKIINKVLIGIIIILIGALACKIWK